MPVTTEDIQVFKTLNTTSYATIVPTLILWIGVFVRMLIQKDKSKFLILIIISILMIVG